MNVGAILSLASISPLIVVDFVFLVEMVAGLFSGRRSAELRGSASATIIVPAHNEAFAIDRTLSDLADAAGRSFPILLVADNCSDETAILARRHGITVIERSDPVRRGKGFALDFAREYLRNDPPEAIIILDADCRTDRKSLGQLAEAAARTGRPVQAINLLDPAPSAPPMVQVSTFAFFIKNKIRQRGLQRLAGSVHLTGTGMCLPWALFNGADLATANIVEDVRLGIELSRKGAHPLLIETSHVWSPHAASDDTMTQRSRWEGGFLSLARQTVPTLLREAFARGSIRLLLSALDLAVPPLALLILLNVAALVICALLVASGLSSAEPLVALFLVGGASAAAILIAWSRGGRRFLSPRALLSLPGYVLWKLPMYVGLARRGAPKNWVRTERPGRKD